MRWHNPLPSANSRQPFCFRLLRGIGWHFVSSGLGSLAAVAEGERWEIL